MISLPVLCSEMRLEEDDPHCVLCEGGFLYQKVLIFSQCSCEVDGMKTKPFYESISASYNRICLLFAK